MAIRFRKSVKVAPGVKLNFSKKSASVTVGGKLFRETVSTSGKKTQSVSIPGTGIYATKTVKKSAGASVEKTDDDFKFKTLRNESDEIIMEEAKNWLKTQSVCKSSIMASHLNIPISQAERIIDNFERAGLVGFYRGAQGREIYNR